MLDNISILCNYQASFYEISCLHSVKVYKNVMMPLSYFHPVNQKSEEIALVLFLFVNGMKPGINVLEFKIAVLAHP